MVPLATQYMRTTLAVWALAGVWLLPAPTLAQAADNARRLVNDEDLRFWLQNMLVHHQYSAEEVSLATGLSAKEVAVAMERLKIKPADRQEPAANAPLLVLPYPGGRHPRIGFLDGAVDPQRETKVSVFAPWNDGGYAVADMPEAIWMQTDPGRELLYLAHSHVPTHWTKKGVTLEQLEWKRADGGWRSERKLPNSVVFGTQVRPGQHGVRMESWLTNGTDKTLRGLVVQNCVMLKGLRGFEQQTNDNKLLRNPFVACHNADKTRWIITAWQPTQRVWANPPCPCLHSDPKFPDCEPGQTVRIHGWLSFYEGKDIDQELKRIDRIRATGQMAVDGERGT